MTQNDANKEGRLYEKGGYVIIGEVTQEEHVDALLEKDREIEGLKLLIDALEKTVAALEKVMHQGE